MGKLGVSGFMTSCKKLVSFHRVVLPLSPTRKRDPTTKTNGQYCFGSIISLKRRGNGKVTVSSWGSLS